LDIKLSQLIFKVRKSAKYVSKRNQKCKAAENAAFIYVGSVKKIKNIKNRKISRTVR
jgi:hypothetical protein